MANSFSWGRGRPAGQVVQGGGPSLSNFLNGWTKGRQLSRWALGLGSGPFSEQVRVHSCRCRGETRRRHRRGYS